MSATTPLMQHHSHHELKLQGPRPSSLIVSRDSHAVKKRRHRQHHQQPVIIYVESPKVIHAHPSEFRSVVQRLTGAPPSSGSGGGGDASALSSLFPAASPPQLPFQLHGLANAALNIKYYDDMDDGGRSPLLPPFMASTTLSSQMPPVPAASDDLAGGRRGSLSSFFGSDPAGAFFFPFENQSMAPAVVAGCPTGSAVQANSSSNLMLSSGAPLLFGGAWCRPAM